MKNSKRGFVLPLLLVIAVLVIGGGAYYYSQTKVKVPDTANQQNQTNKDVVSTTTNKAVTTNKNSDQAAGWKTYTNASTGVSFRYPSEWFTVGKIQQGEDNVNFTKVLIPEGQPMGTKSFLAFSSGSLYAPRGQGLSPNEYVDYYYPDTTSVFKEYLTINNIPVLKYQEPYDVRYIFFTKDKMYQFVVYQKSPSPNENPPYVSDDLSKIEKIIASFKLANSNEKFVEIWKTYTNKDLGFSFRYPPEMGEPTVATLSTSVSIDFKTSNYFNYGFHYNQATGRNFTFEEWINSEMNTLGSINVTRKDIMVNGKKAVEIYSTDKVSGGGRIDIYISMDSNGTILSFGQYNRAPGAVNIDEILPTLKFIK